MTVTVKDIAFVRFRALDLGRRDLVASQRPQPDPEGEDSLGSGPSCVPNGALVLPAVGVADDRDSVQTVSVHSFEEVSNVSVHVVGRVIGRHTMAAKVGSVHTMRRERRCGEFLESFAMRLDSVNRDYG